MRPWIRRSPLSTLLSTGVALAVLCVILPTHADHPCTSPLLLDLNDEGRIRTVSVDDGVSFDINSDGTLERIGWTHEDGEEGFLWLDFNRNRRVDDGRELFGDSTPLPEGGRASNGFEALALYDRPEVGGNGDGVIDARDLIWPHLRLWVDANRDGASAQAEIFRLREYGVVGIGLDYVEVDELDGALNRHTLRGAFVRETRRYGRVTTSTQRVDDVVFDWRP